MTDTPDDHEQAIDTVIEQLTLQEKIQMVHGMEDPQGIGIGYLPPIERVDIPPLRFADGPLGVGVGEATAFPASIALAATWDPELAYQQGSALGREATAKGINVLLAPAVNIIRVPTSGRTFECYSEDPHLTSRFAVNVVSGIQSQGTIATAKHYIANNQETNRFGLTVTVSERALREIYLPGFKAAIQEAGVGSIMAAYNKVNGTHASQHPDLLTHLLKDELGFDGYVVSDWWGTLSTEQAAHAGLDLEMPAIPVSDVVDIPDILVSIAAWLPGRIATPASVPNPANVNRFSAPLREAVEAGRVSHTTLNDKVRRILQQRLRQPAINSSHKRVETGGIEPSESDPECQHRNLAQQIAAEGTVLLENRNKILPLNEHHLDSLAIIGPNADTAKIGGGGSASVTPSQTVSPVEGIRHRADADVQYEPGVERITHSAPSGMSQASHSTMDQTADPSIERAVAAAEQATVAVVFVQDDATEGRDQSTLALPGRQNELIEAVAGVNDQTIVVLNTSGPVLMPWIESVPAVLEAWYPGQEDGMSVASVLFGDITPAGKLPVTFAQQTTDYPVTTTEQHSSGGDVAEYSEGIFVGYRYFDKHGIDPLFPFGHGLSYTTFEYTNLQVSDALIQPNEHVSATVRVQNTGAVDGAETVQLYLCPPQTDIERPVKELVAFSKLRLEPGEYREVEFDISGDALSYYDAADGEWTVSAGTYEVLIGSSSRDIRLRDQFAVD